MSSRFDEMRVFTGTGNPSLAQAICERLGFGLGDATVTQFSNENIFVKLNESVREKDVFVVQSLASPLSDNIMELLILLDTCRRASAGRVTAVIPYFAYGRTDKRDQPRVPITARLLADMIQVAGAHQVITLDLHAGQIQGFFSIPMDELSGMPLLVRHFAEKGWDDAVVVAPDVGFAKRARNFAEELGVPLAIAEKRRLQQLSRSTNPSTGGLSVSSSTPQVLNLIGEVQDKRCIIVDDEIASGRSVLAVADLLVERGAREVYACCTHAVLAGDAIERFKASPVRELVCTDTLPLSAEKRWPGLTVLSVSTLLAEVIQRIHSGVSVDEIYHRRNPALS